MSSSNDSGQAGRLPDVQAISTPESGSRSPQFIRHVTASHWCLVAETTTHSHVTRCRCRIALTDSFELHDDPPVSERCGGCEPRGGATHAVRDYADAFESVEALRPSGCLSDFDVSDLGGKS